MEQTFRSASGGSRALSFSPIGTSAAEAVVKTAQRSAKALFHPPEALLQEKRSCNLKNFKLTLYRFPVPVPFQRTILSRVMKFSGDQIVAAVVATSFAAGLNVYATVATLGLLAHAGVLALPPALGILASWWVIGISVALFAIEFVADKIPAFDLVWNTLHTFIRIPVAALLAYRATAALSPWEQMAATAAGGVIAFAAHGGKTAARAAATASPEPFSNAALSLGEDGLAIFLTWFATQHPYTAAGIVACLLVIIVLLARWVLRSLRALFQGAENLLAGSPHS